MSAEPVLYAAPIYDPAPRPWIDQPISFERWRDSERVILRGIARRAQAVFQEGSDPALTATRAEALELLQEWNAWRAYGLGRGWQP